MEVPMLEEDEWEAVVPLLDLRRGFADLRQYSVEHGISLSEAKSAYGPCPAALDAYFKLTGFRETNSNALHHHRVSLYGPPCRVCGKPLRTALAKHCAECGAPRLG